MEHQSASSAAARKTKNKSKRSREAAPATEPLGDVSTDAGQLEGSLAVSNSRGAASGRQRGPDECPSHSPHHNSSAPSGSSSGGGHHSSARQDCPPSVSAAGATSAQHPVRHSKADPPNQAAHEALRQQPASFVWVWIAATACCIVLAAAWMARPVGPTHCHPQLGSTVVGALLAVADPVWHQLLKSFEDELSCASLSAADAKARAAVVMCRSEAECQRVAWSFPSSDFRVDIQHFDSGTAGVVGQLQKQLVSLSRQYPYGVVVLHNVLASGLANVHTLIAALSEQGHLTHNGAPVRLQPFVFVLVEQVSPEDLDSALAVDVWRAAQQLRRIIRARMQDHYGAQSGSNGAAVLDAMLRRVDVVASVK